MCTYEYYITGWLGAFSFFSSKGERLSETPAQEEEEGQAKSPWPRINLNALFHSIATCPAQVNDNGVNYNATLLVGQLTFDYRSTTTTTNSSAAPNDLPAAVARTHKAHDMRVLHNRNDWPCWIDKSHGRTFTMARIIIQMP